MCIEASKEPPEGSIPVEIIKWADIPDFIINPENKFQEFVNELKVVSQDIMNEHTHLPPVVIFVMEDGGVYLMELGKFLSSNTEKDFITNLIKELIKSRKDPAVYGTIMASEAWMAMIPKDNKELADEVLNGIKAVSELKEKEEVILLNVQTRTSGKLVKIPITRIDEKMILLGQPEELPSMEKKEMRFSFFE